MQDIAGMPCPPARNSWVRTEASDGRRRVARFIAPAMTATVLVALILHLLVELASRLPAADPLGAVSVIGGMAAVLLTLMPFTLFWARRAQCAWAAGTAGGRPRGGR